MNLAIDIGNTCAKLAVIENGQVVDFFKTDTLSEVYLEQLLENFPDITGAILISVHEDSDAPIETLLRRRAGRFIRFGHGVPVPIRNGYATPDTLGSDRLAAAVMELLSERSIRIAHELGAEETAFRLEE